MTQKKQAEHSPKYPLPDNNDSIPINFRLRGLYCNKIHEDLLTKCGKDATHYIKVVGFLLKHLDFNRFNSLAYKDEYDAQTLDYIFSAIGGMIQEFADEAFLVIDMLDDYNKQLKNELEVKKNASKETTK